ncbi:putative transcription factor Trihelix family [Lupinus albus]|uniref:Putative transcription factor Trihelix family n=1 Tax=Lupinus albus TaxID=3870 RepID=A0A6A4N8J0_LUPAL|nr:putative transcription factor Trihelix family [Lupinus albus]
MDDMEDDARYPPNSFSLNRQNHSHRQKNQIQGTPYHHHRPIPTRYVEESDEDEEPDKFDNYDAEEDEFEEGQNGYGVNFENDDGFGKNPSKKRKVRDGHYELAPRLKMSYNRSSANDWTEHATFVLLEVWGDKFLQLGRNSLRLEDWNDVAEKVSEELKVERNVFQCRNMLDKLKSRYKKEKARIDEMCLSISKWAYFKKMDMLMASSSRQEYGLACGVDSGEYVFMNTRVYLNKSNGFDEMRDSPGESETDEDNDDSKTGIRGSDDEDKISYRVLSDSIQKFGRIYEKIENSKRKQMMELEKMRLDFNRELEVQNKQILERAQAEIAKIKEVHEVETETSAENLSE